MQNRMLAEGSAELPDGVSFAPDLTTTAVARAFGMTPAGVRYLVDAGHLSCRRTQARWRTFRAADVLRLGDRRTRLKLAGKLPRRRKLGPRGEPRQLDLLGFRKVK